MDIDHLFVCTQVGAPVAEQLVEAGVLEGRPNIHPGQGTACRRFFFDNFMLELVWVTDPAEAKASPTKLWDRWHGSAVLGKTSPFGVILCPAEEGEEPAAPFPHWEYQPETMPGLRLWIASETVFDEPMWCLMPMLRPAHQRRQQPIAHPAGMRELTGIRIHSPAHWTVDPRAMAGSKLDWQESAAHWVELEFDEKESGRSLDLRPALPVVLLW